MSIKTFGPVDDRSLKQLQICMQAGDAEFGVLCADHHPGYSQPIGGGIAYEGYISPSGGGYDIGCGNQAVETGMTREGEMDSPPVLLPIDGDLGQSYIEAMTLAGRYAYAGRDVVVDKVLDILGARPVYEVHNHHNFAWREEHFGRTVWVIRKGCTPAEPGQQGFVGGSMGDASALLEGVEGEGSRESLYATGHRVGRAITGSQPGGQLRLRPVQQ